MRLVCISDTHETWEDIDLPDGDVLIDAGDSTYMGTAATLRLYNAWLGRQKHKHKVIIAGNHDWLYEKDPTLAQSIITNAIYLQDSGVTIDGINFWGSPVQPWFHSWAFNRGRGPAIRKHWDLIPANTNVLITHGPPYKIGDTVYRRGIPYDAVGCADLAEVVRLIKPQVHVFGHIHSGHGLYDIDGVKYANAAICDENYHPTNKAIVIDI